MTQDPYGEDTAVQDALRRQIEDPLEHDVTLIDECLGLTPDERLQRLTSWVAFVASARPIEGLPALRLLLERMNASVATA